MSSRENKGCRTFSGSKMSSRESKCSAKHRMSAGHFVRHMKNNFDNHWVYPYGNVFFQTNYCIKLATQPDMGYTFQSADWWRNPEIIITLHRSYCVITEYNSCVVQTINCSFRPRKIKQLKVNSCKSTCRICDNCHHELLTVHGRQRSVWS